MSTLIVKPSRLEGFYNCFFSKSETHRALITSAFSSNNNQTISNVNVSNDVLETINVLKTLGAEFNISGDVIRLIKCVNDTFICDVTIHESASTLRLLLPILIYKYHHVIIRTDERLFERGISGFYNVFKDNDILYSANNNVITIDGTFNKTYFEVDTSESSQYLSGMILASVMFDKTSTFKIDNNCVSFPYVKMTLHYLKKQEIKYSFNNDLLVIEGNQNFIGNDLFVNADLSINAFFLIFNYFNSLVKFNKYYAFDDRSNYFEESLKALQNGMPTIDLANLPDTSTLLIVSSSLLNGGRFINFERLKTKESNRVKAVCDLMDNFSIHYEFVDNCLIVNKSNLTYPKQNINPYHDHRIFLTAIFLCSFVGGKIDDLECLNKSSFDYISTYKSLGLDCEIEYEEHDF